MATMPAHAQQAQQSVFFFFFLITTHTIRHTTALSSPSIYYDTRTTYYRHDENTIIIEHTSIISIDDTNEEHGLRPHTICENARCRQRVRRQRGSVRYAARRKTAQCELSARWCRAPAPYILPLRQHDVTPPPRCRQRRSHMPR